MRARGGPVTRSPASADVMGGIVEDSGSLVLTTTLATAPRIGMWPIDDRTADSLIGGGATVLGHEPTPGVLPGGLGLYPAASSVANLVTACREVGASGRPRHA